MAVREDSASVHAGGAFSQFNLSDRYDASADGSAHGSAVPDALQPAAAPVPHAPIQAGALGERLAVVRRLRKQRKTLLAEKKFLSGQIVSLNKLNVPASRLWEEYAVQDAAFKQAIAWGSVCTLSLVEFLGGFAFFKGAYDARTHMSLVRQVLEAGGPQALVATLQEKLDRVTQDLQATTAHLDAA